MILAHDNENGIGYNGDLPWSRCDDDMRLFRCLTTGNDNNNNNNNNSQTKKSNLIKLPNAVIMGYNTWISLPTKHRPLKNRVNIVLSNSHCEELCKDANFINGSNYDVKNMNNSQNTYCYVFTNWFDVKQHLEIDIFSGLGKYKEVWIIGGAEIYKGAIENLCISYIYRTMFKNTFLCDKFINIEDLLIKKGCKFDKTKMKETKDYIVECLEVKQRVIC
jgi:dihydrofolate reductase